MGGVSPWLRREGAEPHRSAVAAGFDADFGGAYGDSRRQPGPRSAGRRRAWWRRAPGERGSASLGRFGESAGRCAEEDVRCPRAHGGTLFPHVTCPLIRRAVRAAVPKNGQGCRELFFWLVELSSKRSPLKNEWQASVSVKRMHYRESFEGPFNRVRERGRRYRIFSEVPRRREWRRQQRRYWLVNERIGDGRNPVHAPADRGDPGRLWRRPITTRNCRASSQAGAARKRSCCSLSPPVRRRSSNSTTTCRVVGS